MVPSLLPLVSVVVPVRDGARFLAQAIESVRAQTLTAWELVVIDDGSADASLEVARGFCCDGRVRAVGAPPRGLAAARNLGLLESRAPYVTFLDSDDRLRAGALARMVSRLDREPRAAMVYGEAVSMDAQGRVQGVDRAPLFARRPSGAVLEALLERNFIASSGATCLRRSFLDEVGPFRNDLVPAEDWEMWCRLSAAGEVHYLGPGALLEKRTHDDSISATLGSSPEPATAGIEAVFSHPAVRALGVERTRTLRTRQEASVLAIAAGDRLKRRQTAVARRYLWAALQKHPQARELLMLAATFVPGGARALRPWLK